MSHSSGKPCVVFLWVSLIELKKNIQISRTNLVFKFVHKNSNVNTSSNNLITFKSLKRGLLGSKKPEKVMILMAFFCNTKIA